MMLGTYNQKCVIFKNTMEKALIQDVYSKLFAFGQT